MIHRIAGKFGSSFFLYLALLAAVLVVVDVGMTRWVGGMERTTFDWLVKHRIHYGLADRQIIIVDIDDASIRELSKQYGRWPWPREVIGSLVEKIAAADPRAIVFDIAFSESDRLNLESDQRFVARIERFTNIFFPMVLLDENEGGALPMKSVPGASKISPLANDGDKISVLLPFFRDTLLPGRIGTNNITPDKDGVIRRFALARDHRGWEIPSIALQVAQYLKFKPLENRDFLVNWRGPPFSYTSVSFSQVMAAPETGANSHLKDDFGGKIVIIGSTAASLFDIKASPVAHIHPGVEILATVIDNLKNNDPLREFPPSVYGLAAVIFVFLLAFAFHFERSTFVTDGLFFVLQLMAVGICYLLLNLGNTYIDMTVPIAFSVGYFTVARIYAHYLTEFRANRAIIDLRSKDETSYYLTVMAIMVTAEEATESRQVSQIVDRAIEESVIGASRAADMFAASQVLADLFQNISLVYWLGPGSNGSRQSQIEIEVERMTVALRALNCGNTAKVGVSAGKVSAADYVGNHPGQAIVLSALYSIIKPKSESQSR